MPGPPLQPPGSRKYRWYGLVQQGQDSFAQGAFFNQEQIPTAGVEDLVNAFLDDDGDPQRRGGSVYRGSVLGGGFGGTWKPFMFWDGYLAAGRRTVQVRRDSTQPTESSDRLFMQTADESGWVVRGTGIPAAKARMVALAGVLFYPDGQSQPRVNYVGSNLTDPTATPAGTITLTNGSPKVTGSGTNFTTSVIPGQVLEVSSISGATNDLHLIGVQSVTSDTQLILAVPWNAETISFTAPNWSGASQNSMSLLYGTTYTNSAPLLGSQTGPLVLGAAAGRLLVGRGDRVAFSANDPGIFRTTNYHQMPAGALVTGIEGIRDTAVVFTTRGAFAIRNLAYDLTDAQGNVQQTLESLDSEFVLWGELGLAQWHNTIIAPATDGVYLVDAANRPQPVGSESLGSLYRGYVQAGYQPGQVAVHRSYYFLPILNGDTWVDTLVCDLRRQAWMRWDGHGGRVSHFARRVQDPNRQPLLLGLEANPGQRLLDLSATLTPSAAVKNDADGTTHQLKVTTRTLQQSAVAVQWRKLRVHAELDDAASDNPTLQAELATGRPGSSFTTLPGAAPEGDPDYVWSFSKRARLVRFRLTSVGPSSKCVVRRFEVFSRPGGRQ